MKQIQFCGHSMTLHHHGVLFWPAQNLAIVSDLHLEKGSHFAVNGQFVPPHDSYDTLLKLNNVLNETPAKTVLFLGDSFHDHQGYERMNQTEREMFDALCRKYKIIWVVGNHDASFVPEGIKTHEEIVIANITFRHEHESGAKGEISGHFHPKANIRLQGKKVSRPCFLHDESIMIMPSFGTFTGGLNHTDPAFNNMFKGEYHLGLLGQRRLYYFKSSDV